MADEVEIHRRVHEEERMTATYQEYREILQRVPHIRRAEIVDDGDEGIRVHVVSNSQESPRHVVREIVSLLRTAGWHEIGPGNVVMVQMQAEDEPRNTIGRLQIAGFSVGYGSRGYEADCRLIYGSYAYRGFGTAGTAVMAIAQAALAAVNEAIGQGGALHLMEASQLTVSGVTLALALIIDQDGEFMAGNAILRETVEETMIRAVLDAINRRFILYTGQKV